MFEAIIFVSILFVFLTTFIFWCCEKKRDLDTRIIGGAFIVYCFISVFAQTYLLPILEIIDWDKRISLQMQLTALVVGLTAAIIAFRNYHRKSGQDIYYAFTINEGQGIANVNDIILYNNKDRATVIFAFDIIMLSDNTRIRVFQDNTNPIVISAYSSIVINLRATSKYTSDYIPDSFFKEYIKCICVTLSGNIIAKQANNVDMLTDDFKQKCVFPLTTLYMPKEYDKDIVSYNATHWVKFIESSWKCDCDDSPNSLSICHKVLVGYYNNDIFYITPEPNNDDNLGKYLHEKTKQEIDKIKLNDIQNYESGYFQRSEGIGLMSLEKILFTEVTKQ